MKLKLITSLSAVFVLVSLTAIPAVAEDIERIEEVWELNVNEPDVAIDAPQISTSMLPLGSDSDLLFQVDINCASVPIFEPGGLQIRICNDNCLFDSERIEYRSQLSHASETVTWTQVVQKGWSGFHFALAEGNSMSFGSFGGESTHNYISFDQAGSSSLNLYRHQDSIDNSGVTYAGNRVGWLKLKEVRVYDSQGLIANVSVQ